MPTFEHVLVSWQRQYVYLAHRLAGRLAFWRFFTTTVVRGSCCVTPDLEPTHPGMIATRCIWCNITCITSCIRRLNPLGLTCSNTLGICSWRLCRRSFGGMDGSCRKECASASCRRARGLPCEAFLVPNSNCEPHESRALYQPCSYFYV